jgi:hypothetical protein
MVKLVREAVLLHLDSPAPFMYCIVETWCLTFVFLSRLIFSFIWWMRAIKLQAVKDSSDDPYIKNLWITIGSPVEYSLFRITRWEFVIRVSWDCPPSRGIRMTHIQTPYFPYWKHVCAFNRVCWLTWAMTTYGIILEKPQKAQNAAACASSIPVSDLLSIDQLLEKVCPSS